MGQMSENVAGKMASVEEKNLRKGKNIRFQIPGNSGPCSILLPRDLLRSSSSLLLLPLSSTSLPSTTLTTFISPTNYQTDQNCLAFLFIWESTSSDYQLICSFTVNMNRAIALLVFVAFLLVQNEGEFSCKE